DRDVHYQRTPRRVIGVQLICIADLGQVPTRFTQNVAEIQGKALVKDLFHLAADHLVAGQHHHLFERRVAARYPAVLVNGKQADVDRLDDRFVKFLEQRELFRLLLLFLVKPAVLDGNGYIARNGFENLKVLGREQRTVLCTAEPDDGDHFASNDARHEIMQLL